MICFGLVRTAVVMAVCTYISLIPSISAVAADRILVSHSATDSPRVEEQYKQQAPIKIGVLLPTDGVTSAYEASLQIAIDTIRQQLKENKTLPQIEFVEAKLFNSELQNNREIKNLIQKDVDAIIAPNFLSALLTASPDKLDVLPLVSKANKTHELAIAGETSLYSNLSEHSSIIRTIQKLKFRGRLEQVVVMYDTTDPFGRFGYDVIVDILSKEKASFSTEIFSAKNVDFIAKLEAIKEASPHTTVIIVGNTEDVADVIVRAQNDIGLTGNVLGFIGDGNPAVYDLADPGEGNYDVSGVAWDVVPAKELSDLVVSQFNNDRFAAEAYIAIWTILSGISNETLDERAEIRAAFTEHEGHHLETPSARLAAWFYRYARDSIDQTIRTLNSL